MDQPTIVPYRNQIMNPRGGYKIVNAETGAGKSTQIPIWHMLAGNSVLMAEPLIETVIGTAEYLCELTGEKLGGKIGFRTGKDRCDSRDTQILICTTELALVREICGHNRRFNTLIIDEFHEGRLDQETLEAFAWKGMLEGTSAFSEVDILSATMDHQRLSQARNNAPVFNIPGRQFPIKDLKPGEDIASDIKRLVREGWDVLVFMAGKADIKKLIQALQGVDCELIPFHGQCSREEKNLAYKSYNRPKVVVSTNALETGRTLLPSKGRQLAIVDSGMENRIELVNGVEGLYPRPIAVSRAMQRRGRGGRVGPSVYIDHCPVSRKDRPMYPDPEIFRVRLDQTVLRLAEYGFDLDDLPFFHKPKSEQIKQSKNSLRALGCLEDGEVTELGRAVAKMPISPQNGRMVIEAEKLEVLDDVISIAAILELGEVTAKTKSFPRWRKLIGDENESDVMAQLAVFKAARDMNPDEMRENDIHVSNYFKVLETRKLISESLRKRSVRPKFGSTGEREDIVKAVCAGMVDHLYERKPDSDVLSNGFSVDRQIVFDSLVKQGTWFVGIPHDQVQQSTFGKPKVRHQLRMVTRVNPVILAEVAPKLARSEDLCEPKFDEIRGNTYVTSRVYFRGRVVFEGEVVVTTPEARKNRADWLAAKAWDEFVPPQIDCPILTDIEAEIPELCEIQYGTYAIRNVPLIAYGALDNSFACNWYKDQKQAQAARNRAVAKLGEIKVRRLHDLATQAQKAYGAKLKQSGTRLNQLANASASIKREETSQWIRDTLSLLHSVEEEIAGYQKAQQQSAMSKLISLIWWSKPVQTEFSHQPGAARQVIAALEAKLPIVAQTTDDLKIVALDSTELRAKRRKRA